MKKAFWREKGFLRDFAVLCWMLDSFNQLTHGQPFFRNFLFVILLPHIFFDLLFVIMLIFALQGGHARVQLEKLQIGVDSQVCWYENVNFRL